MSLAGVDIHSKAKQKQLAIANSVNAVGQLCAGLCCRDTVIAVRAENRYVGQLVFRIDPRAV